MGNSNEFISGLLNAIVQDIKNGADYEHVEIGKVSNELKNKYRKLIQAKEDLSQEMKVRKEVLEAELELQLYREFNDRIEEHKDQKDAMWMEIEKELGITEDKDLTIDRKTGMVSEKIKKTKSPEQNASEIFFQKLKDKRRI